MRQGYTPFLLLPRYSYEITYFSLILCLQYAQQKRTCVDGLSILGVTAPTHTYV